MKCPHCLVEVNPSFAQAYIGSDSDGHWSVFHMKCPNNDCKKLIAKLAKGKPVTTPGRGIVSIDNVFWEQYVNPLSTSRTPVPKEIEEKFAKDYSEACLILSLSPKASAALSRRCLQNILREKAGVKKQDLSKEIEEVIDKGNLPQYLKENIDAVRAVGNFAAHPTKDKSTGEIIHVEPGEAEWLLDVIEELFDFYFVQPEISKQKREKLNEKLVAAGKQPMK